MDKLSNAITKEIVEPGSTDLRQRYPLDDAAREWASHALETFTGELLRKALDISASIASFTNELHNRS